MKMHAFQITTNASGAWTDYFELPAGLFYAYHYVPDGTSPLATGANLDITGANSGIVYSNQDSIGTSAFTKYPRSATHDETGAASLYASGGEPVETLIPVAEPLKAVIAAGGDTKKGTLYVWIA